MMFLLTTSMILYIAGAAMVAMLVNDESYWTVKGVLLVIFWPLFPALAVGFKIFSLPK